MGGHVFVAQGDLLLLECDAWLAPTDGRLDTAEPWRSRVVAPSGPPHGWDMYGVRVASAAAAADRDGVPPPRPWLVNTGAWPGVSIDWYREGVRQFVETAAAALRGTPPRNDRARHLLAVPVVGTGAGGAADVAGDLTRGLLEELRAGASRHDVDIALVARGARAYAAAQAMRRRMGPAGLGPLPQAAAPEIERLAGLARAGRLVLFLGAGIGVGAGLPTWDALLGRLAAEAGMEEGEVAAMGRMQSPLDRARLVEGRLAASERTLARAVREALGPMPRASLAHLLTASLPVSEAATTNYDDLFERAFRATGRTLSVLPYDAAGRDAWLLKMHGSLAHGDEIVLTRDDYLGYAERRAALRGIVQALLITRHMLFVGFSLSDDNFHRVAHDVRRAVRGPASDAEPFGTALFLEENPLLSELWTREIRLVAMASPADRLAIAEQARRLEILLDLLGAEASDPTAHLLDPAYDGLLEAPERRVRERLLALREATSREERETPAWARIEALLRRLGG